jgi:predicted AlkP superfamily phosphohydrolase/phosphomutase
VSRDSGRTVVLGFDALSMRYLAEFDLPNFESLMEGGAVAPLQSTFPPWTGSAWPSMYTGMDPGHHGVYSFFDFDGGYPDEAGLISRNDVAAPALWNYLSAAGVSSAVLNMPVTHPAEPIEGVLVPGYVAPEATSGYPGGIREELSEALGEEYRIYATRETGDSDEEMLRGYVDLIDLRRRAARTLLATHDPTVAIFQVQKTDTVFHQFDDPDAFRRVYEAADRFLGGVLDVVSEDANVIVCSDHGIGPTRGYNIYVNEILRDAGFVRATRDGETPTFERNKSRLAGDGRGSDADKQSTIGSRAVSGLATTLAGIGIQPGDVYSAATHLGVDGVLQHLLPGTDSISRHVDWAASKAYCRRGPELGVRINLDGRHPEGVVSRDQYGAVRERVIKTLSSVETPSGDPAFDWVRRREAVYSDARTEDACDVLFQPAGMNHMVATNLLGKQFVPIDMYNHKREGVFVGAGPNINAGVSLERLSLTDVAPVIMALAECTVPERMTGSVPTDLLDVPADVGVYDDIAYGSASDATGDGEVKARLEDLGYL